MKNNFIPLQGCYTTSPIPPKNPHMGSQIDRMEKVEYKVRTQMWEEVDDIRIYFKRAGRAFVGISVSESTDSNSSSALKAVAYSKQKDSFLFSINIHNPFEMNSAFRLHPCLNLKPTCLEKHNVKLHGM